MAQTLPTTVALAEFRPRIYGYVLGLVRSRSDADDLTQDTFVRAYQQLESLRNPEAALPWLYSIATHVCLDRLRARTRERSHDSGLDPEAVSIADTGGPGELRLERDEMSDCVKGYFGELSDSHRAVLLLHDVHGLTSRQIAELLGDSPGSVKIRLHRARGRLRDTLASECSFSYDECGTLICEPVS